MTVATPRPSASRREDRAEMESEITVYDKTLNTVYIDFSPYAIFLSVIMFVLPMVIANAIDRLLSP